MFMHEMLDIADDLLIATMMVMLTVGMHGTGLVMLGRLLRLEAGEERVRHVPAFSWRTIAFTQMLVIALFVLHGLEIWLYAFVYLGLGAIGDISNALYFSTISYAAIGFSDHAISVDWRMVGAIEGINGLLLIGWSTAFFVAVVTRLGRT